MEIGPFEKAIVESQLVPLQVFFKKGRQVKYFVCAMGDEYEVKPFDLIVFDQNARAYVLPNYHRPIKEETIFNIQYFDFDGSLRLNGNILERHPNFDLFKERPTEDHQNSAPTEAPQNSVQAEAPQSSTPTEAH